MFSIYIRVKGKNRESRRSFGPAFYREILLFLDFRPLFNWNDRGLIYYKDDFYKPTSAVSLQASGVDVVRPLEYNIPEIPSPIVYYYCTTSRKARSLRFLLNNVLI